MNILLTGATGLLGNNVLRLLLADNHKVSVVVREGSDSRPLDSLDVEKIFIDLATDAENDGQIFRTAIKGIDTVIHCAGLIQLGWTLLEQSMKINRDATRMIAEVCRIHNMKLIHVSSVDALAVGSFDTPANEESIDPSKVGISYVQSKRAADRAVWDEIAKGLNGVIVHPGLMFGPWDWKPSSGKVMTTIGKGFVPFAPSGGVSVCDARDVAAGIVSAMHHAPGGESYILAGANVTYIELWRQIARLVNRKEPWGRLPWWIGAIAGNASDLISRFKKSELQSNSGAIKIGSFYNWYSSDKAKRDLGYQISPIDIALADTYDWFKDHNYL